MRVSYNDYKLYLSILESVSKQLNRAIKSEVISGSKDEIPKHDFDGETTVFFNGYINNINIAPTCLENPRISRTISIPLQ